MNLHMSATMRAEDFRIFHEPPPVIEVPAQDRHPLTVHFSRKTEIVDYLCAAYKKAISIHKNMPPGGILVFVTGQKEVEDLCSMLRKASKSIARKNSSKVDDNEIDALEDNEIKEADDEESDFSCHTDESESDLEFEADDDDDDDLGQVKSTGKEKVKEFNSSSGIESFKVQWISKASAAQRKGRAGRTGHVHCYCLYTSSVFHREFSKFSIPDISKASVDGVLLLLKSIGIKVADFPFPTHPYVASLVEAEHCLKALEALDEEGKLTSLGKITPKFPMRPRHPRLLLAAVQDINKRKHCVRSNLVLGYAVAADAALSVPNPFIFQHGGNSKNDNSDSQEQDEKTGLGRKNLKEAVKLFRSKFTNIKSDTLTVAHALQCLIFNPWYRMEDAV